MVNTCVAVDYIATIAITVLMVYFLFRMSKMYLSPPIRTFLTLVTGLYMATYVYTSFLVGVFNVEFLNYVIALITLLVVLIISYYLNAHVVVLGLLLVLTMEGYEWYAVLSVSLLVGVIFAIIVYAYELDYLGLLIWDSLFIAMALVIGTLALTTNSVTSLESQIPSTCRISITNTTAEVGHLNMLFPCDPGCGSVASMQYDRQLLIGLVIGLAVLRFGLVYYREVCGVPKEELRAGYKKQQVLRRKTGDPEEPETKQAPESNSSKKKQKNNSRAGFSCGSLLAALCPGGRSGDTGAPFTALVAQPADDDGSEDSSSKHKNKNKNKNKKKKKRHNSLSDDDSKHFEIEMLDVPPKTSVDLELKGAPADRVPSAEVKREMAVAAVDMPAVLREIAVVAPPASVIEELKEHKSAAEEEAAMLA